MKKIREFATGWGNDYPMTWSDRVEEDLVGTAIGKKSHLLMPMMRPFDFLIEPNKPVTYLSNDQSLISVEAVRGTQDQFHRNADYDEIFFQWGGETGYETECGTYEMKAAELMIIPAGISHRATGSADSLRLSFRVKDRVEVAFKEEDMIGHTEFHVTWNGGPDWPVPKDRAKPKKGKVVESIHTWRDQPGDETLIEREYDRLVGATTEGRLIHKIRLFDIFKEVTGRKGPGPISMKNDDFMIECYNTDGEQFGFHRGLRNDEAQFQYAATATGVCEFGTDHMGAGDMYLVRRGIAHRVIASDGYRRMVIYNEAPWDVLIDPAKPVRNTTFEVEETVIEAAPWRNDLVSAQRAAE